MPGPEVSVVIPTRNRAARLDAALASLQAQTVPADRFEVLVVDEASDDGTAEVLERRAGGGLNLRHLRREVAAGPAVARNDGWRAAAAPLVAFLDDDCEAAPGWLAAGVEAWGGDAHRFVQGQTVPKPEELGLMGPFSYTIDLRGETPAYPTCNMFYPRELLERAGGFDAVSFPFQGEDTDLAWRALEAGGEPAFAAEASAEHAVVRIGPWAFLRRAWSWGNTMELLVRHPGFRRRRLVYRIFWNPSHYEFARLGLALLLPRKVVYLPLAAWLAKPYLTHRLGHPRDGRWAPYLLPWYLVVDATEMAGVLRGSLKHGTFAL